MGVSNLAFTRQRKFKGCMTPGCNHIAADHQHFGRRRCSIPGCRCEEYRPAPRGQGRAQVSAGR